MPRKFASVSETSGRGRDEDDTTDAVALWKGEGTLAEGDVGDRSGP